MLEKWARRGGPNQFGSKLPSVKFKRRPFILLSVRFSKVTFSTQFTGLPPSLSSKLFCWMFKVCLKWIGLSTIHLNSEKILDGPKFKVQINQHLLWNQDLRSMNHNCSFYHYRIWKDALPRCLRPRTVSWKNWTSRGQNSSNSTNSLKKDQT